MLVLGIESTCDETAAAIVKDGHEILSHVIFSQIDIHEKFGGVFPELASRSHVEKIIGIINKAIKNAKISFEDIDLIAVAKGPGLIGSLLVGLNVAKSLSLAWHIPYIGINHVEAHLYAAMMGKKEKVQFPALGVVISGGHTCLLQIQDIGKYACIGTTIDDAIGESFDKVAAIVGLPYPGGPAIEKIAQDGDKKYFKNIKPAKVKNQPFYFSFSGLKTKVLYTAKGQSANKSSPLIIKEEEKKHLAAAFQHAALSDIVDKTLKSAKTFHANAIYVGGGVSNNMTLRKMFENENLSIPIFWPQKGLSLDNAAMIAGLGFQKYKSKGDPLDLEAMTRIPLFTSEIPTKIS